MKINWKKLIISLAVPLAVGGLSAWLSGGAMERFDSLQKPALAPPSWLFPVVWTILFLMMGVASYLVAEGKADEKQKKDRTYRLRRSTRFQFCVDAHIL